MLKEAVDSVVAQTFKDLEIIIVDDGSTDNSESLIRSINDERIKYIIGRQGKPSVARNVGIKESSGQFISFLDSDDILEKDAISTLLKAFDQDSDIGLAYGDFVSFGEGSEKHKFTGYSKIKKSGNVFGSLLMGNFIYNIGTLIRKECFDKVGLFDEDKNLMTEDYDLFLRIAWKYKIAHIKKMIAKYRFHDNNMTVNNRKMILESNINVVTKLHEKLGFADHLFGRAISKIYFDLGKEGVKTDDRNYRRYFIKSIAIWPFSFYFIVSALFIISPKSITKNLEGFLSNVYSIYQSHK